MSIPSLVPQFPPAISFLPFWLPSCHSLDSYPLVSADHAHPFLQIESRARSVKARTCAPQIRAFEDRRRAKRGTPTKREKRQTSSTSASGPQVTGIPDDVSRSRGSLALTLAMSSTP